MFNLNQQKAIEIRNANILVSASAGSGKTKVLVSRIANMLVNGETDISRLLIVTFTKASAIEMQQRLISELTNIRQNATDKLLKDRLLKQIEDINLSDISTIHSFCSKLVRKYFYELNLDPSFKLIEHGLDDLKLIAINNVFNQYIADKDAQFEKMYYVFNEKRNQNTLISTIFNVCDILHKTNEIIKNNEDLCFSTNLQQNSAINFIQNYIINVSNQLLLKIKEYVKSIIITEEKFTQHLSNILNFLKNLLQENFEEQYNAICNYSFAMNRLKENKEDYAYIVNLVKTQIIDPIHKIFEKKSIEEIKRNIKESEWLTFKIIEVSERFNCEFFKLKQQKAILDLSDIENLTIDLLQIQHVRQELQASYDYIFIDEYQDTNQIQETIITSISQNNNLFMVGDAKQSIYGFRLCDPTIFCNKYALFQYEGVNQKIDLNKNYRSNKNILNFTNLVCSKCITEEVGKVNYAKNSMLETEIEINSVQNIPSVQIFAINKSKKEKQVVNVLECKPYSVMKAETNQDNESEILQTEARIIANQIHNLVGSTLKIKQENGFKEKIIKYSDICILSRTKKGYLQKLSALLNEYEIPVSAMYNENIYDYFEIKIIVNALKTISNMYDDVSLVSTLTNLYYFTYSELVVIKQKTNYKNFYECLLNFEKNSDSELYNKIQMFISDITNFKIKSSYLSLFELVNELIDKTNYLTMLNCLQQSKEKIANVNIFLNLLQSQKISINQFLQSLSNPLNKMGKDLSVNNGEDSVKLESIHSSKGLEYPIVILTNCGKDITAHINADAIQFNKNIGISCSAFDTENREKNSSVIQKIIKFANKSDEFEESLRLLYVALTRAKNNLVIVGETQIDKIEPIECSMDIKSCKSYMQLILSCFTKKTISSLKENRFIELENDIQINLLDIEKLKKKENKIEKNVLFEAQPISENQYNIIKNIFEYKYPYNLSTKLSVKNSVSELNHSDDPITTYNYVPKDLTITENVNVLSADKIGTAYHTVMQYINYDIETLDEISLLIENLNKNNKLTQEEIHAIDINKIFNCVQQVKKLINKDSVLKREQQFIMLEKHCNLIKESKLNDEVLVQGIIDLIIVNKDKTYIIDFKTTRANENVLRNIYSKQLELYEKATKYAINSNKTVKLIYSFENNKFITLI